MESGTLPPASNGSFPCFFDPFWAPEFRVPNRGTAYPCTARFNRGVGGRPNLPFCVEIYPATKGENEDWEAKLSDMERNQAADKANCRINCTQKLDFCPRLWHLTLLALTNSEYLMNIVILDQKTDCSYGPTPAPMPRVDLEIGLKLL